MNFTLIVCTYKRANPLLKLLKSVAHQTRYPDEILIIDGSPDEETEKILAANKFEKLHYYKVPPEHRGLTKQRNFGINKVVENSQVICFLDDDTILEENYFEELISIYAVHPEALGVGGYITNEVNWSEVPENYKPANNEFCYDGWKRKESSRFILRKKMGLDSNVPPGFSPEFSHGRSVSFLPPSGKVYPAEQLMGGVSSFKKEIFQKIRFSDYFVGYGLYEDADFSLRLSKIGKLYINTKARLSHHHHVSGRPNQYQYGKMVVRNGWYVWRIANPKPDLLARFKWNAITLLLIAIRFSNIFTTNNKKEATTEVLGRITGLLSLLVKKPKNK